MFPRSDAQEEKFDAGVLEATYRLLLSLFDEGHLRRWVTFIDRSIAAQLPGVGAPFSTLVFETVNLFHRYGEINVFFARLGEEFPNRRAEIRSVEGAYTRGGAAPANNQAMLPALLTRLADAGFFDELARLLSAERAKSYLQVIGIDSGRFSRRYSDGPKAWWAQVVAVLEHGSEKQYSSACRALIVRALKDYPGNPVFRSVRNAAS